MKTYNVFVYDGDRRVFWMAVRAKSMGHAMAMVMGANPPDRFEVRPAGHDDVEAELTGGKWDW